jgi:hypothetical protein
MNQELTLIEKIRSLLLAYGIPSDFEIEQEAEGMIMAALSQDDIVDVHLDDDGTLVIEYNEK